MFFLVGCFRARFHLVVNLVVKFGVGKARRGLSLTSSATQFLGFYMRWMYNMFQIRAHAVELIYYM